MGYQGLSLLQQEFHCHQQFRHKCKLTALTASPEKIEGTADVRSDYVQSREEVNKKTWRKEIGRFDTNDAYLFLFKVCFLAQFLNPGTLVLGKFVGGTPQSKRNWTCRVSKVGVPVFKEDFSAYCDACLFGRICYLRFYFSQKRDEGEGWTFVPGTNSNGSDAAPGNFYKNDLFKKKTIDLHVQLVDRLIINERALALVVSMSYNTHSKQMAHEVWCLEANVEEIVSFLVDEAGIRKEIIEGIPEASPPPPSPPPSDEERSDLTTPTRVGTIRQIRVRAGASGRSFTISRVR